MRSKTRFYRMRALVVLFAMAGLLVDAPFVFAAKGFQGRWQLTVTIPESASSDTQRTFTLILDVSSREESLHGRMTITDEQNRTVGGVWRTEGKKISITYEMPCAESDASCATLVLIGKLKSGKTRLKKGDVIVMWDSDNDRNPALYDTSTGSFSGERLE